MSNTIVGSNNFIAAMTGGVFSLEALARTVTGTNKLQSSPSSIMAYYIINELAKMTDPSDGDTWPLYDSFLPDGPQVETNCGAIYDTSGIMDGRYMSGPTIPHEGIQIRIRSSEKNTGYVKIEDIANALDEITLDSFEIGALEYELQNVSRATPIASLGVEPGTKRRYHYTVNYLLTIRELTG